MPAHGVRKSISIAFAAVLMTTGSVVRTQQLAVAVAPEVKNITVSPISSTLPLIGKPVAAPLITTVEVDGRVDTLRDGLSATHYVTQQEVLSSAGTWGDFSRYLQLLPGVVWTNDYTNEVRVRGGDPNENLYVVDGIEVPNINHLALEGSTGGFASMVDTRVIDSLDMDPGNYDLSFSRRLSSLVEIHTTNGIKRPAVYQLDFGITGGGGTLQRSLGSKAGLLVSAHRSVLNLATNDIGLNGVPVYTNGITEVDWTGEKDRVTLMNLSGADSINMTPDACDRVVTTSVRTSYGGQRSTSGFVWQHSSAVRSSSTLTLDYSSQAQQIDQDWQTTPYGCSREQVQETPVYLENTRDGIATVNYRFVTEKKGWIYASGAMARLLSLNYSVDQPLGGPSPFNPNPNWTDRDDFHRKPATGQTAVFLEVNGHFGSRWRATAGLRDEAFALTGTHFLSAQGTLALRAREHQSMHVSIERSGQLAPAIDILSYAENNRLSPIEATQLAIGGELFRGERVDLSAEAYRKQYSHEPVSTEYPSLMLANMVDTLGQQFIWLPLQSGGTGLSQGVELMFRVNRAQRIRMLSDLTYSRTRYAAGDRILRPGNFDFPIVANGSITVELPWRLEASARNSFASGRPYTPFTIPASEEQSRGIYDLTKINALRGPAYNRLDIDLTRSFRIGKGRFEVHGGVENTINRNNFLGLAWMSSCSPAPTATHCGMNALVVPGVPYTHISQMGRFPSAWAQYRF